MDSVRPPESTMEPLARAPGASAGVHRAARSFAPPAPTYHSASPPGGALASAVSIRGAWSAITPALSGLGKQRLNLRLKFHRQTHVGELESSAHHGPSRI